MNFSMILIMVCLQISIPVSCKDVVTKDGLVLKDPAWGVEEAKKIDRCLKLSNEMSRANLNGESIGVVFQIDRAGKVSHFQLEPYNEKSKLSKANYKQVQNSIIEAIRKSNIRAPELPRAPFYAMYYIAGKKSELAIIAK